MIPVACVKGLLVLCKELSGNQTVYKLFCKARRESFVFFVHAKMSERKKLNLSRSKRRLNNFLFESVSI